MSKAQFSSNPIDVKERARQAEQMLEWLQAHRDELNEWEQGFVASVEARLEEGEGLTDRQLYKLRDVYERVGV